MATIVYAACALLSLMCTLLLARAWARNRERLLLWSAVCFAWLALNNVLLLIDLSFLEDVDLRWARSVTFSLGIGTLLIGLIWDSTAGHEDR